MPTSEWIYEHSFPAVMIALALLSAVLAIGYSLWRQLHLSALSILLGSLRLLFFLLLCWVLLMPATKRTVTEVIKPRFAILLDTSASMTLKNDPDATRTRWESAMHMLELDWAKSVSRKCAVDLYPFDSDLAPPLALNQARTLTPEGRSTHLNLSLSRLLERMRGQELSGILILSDGLDTREKRDIWSEANTPVPLYIAQLEKPGERDDSPDMRVEAIDTPHRAIVGWDTTLSATISGEGGAGTPFPVILYKDGKELEKVAVQFPPEGGSREVQFKLTHPEVATENYLVRIPVLPGEVQTNDNEMAVAVDVLDARNRVLFLEDTPRFESKHLSRALFANPDITPLAFFQLPSTKSPGTKEWIPYGDRMGLSFDLTIDQLRLNKIIILGDFDADALTTEHTTTILEFVEKGGSLILLGGQRLWGDNGIAKTGLSNLLPFTRRGSPATEGKFNVAWTAEGRAHPALVNNPDLPEELPPVLSIFTGCTLSAGSMTLVDAEISPGKREPLLVSRNYGQGKVLTLLSDSLWRWVMQPGTEKPYPIFWRQIIQWMSPAGDDLEHHYLELFTDAGTIAVGDPAILQARLVIPEGESRRNWRVNCEITTPNDRKLNLAMSGRSIQTSGGGEIPGYVAEFVPTEAGNFRAVATVEVDGRTITSAPCLFTVRSTSAELVLKPINERVLRNLALGSGGRYGTIEELDLALRELRVNERRETRLEYRSLWQSALLLTCLFVLLTLEWVTRKMKNLA